MVAMGLLIVIPGGGLIVHLCPNGTLFMLLTVHQCLRTCIWNLHFMGLIVYIFTI